MKRNRPPYLAELILGWLLQDDWQTPLGDFEEYYHNIADQHGAQRARWWYRFQVVKLLPTRLGVKAFWGMIMLKNYLNVAFRNLRRQPGYAIVNMTGLAVGIACFLLIALYVFDELSYDRFHANAEHIVRIVEDNEVEGQLNRYAYTYGPLAPILETEIPSVIDAVRFYQSPMLVSLDAATQFQEGGFVFADSTFLDMFHFPLLQGNPQTVLDAPFSLVLTASSAQKYFGETNPIGKTLQVRDQEESYEFTITGVMADVPGQTHFRFDMMASMGSLRQVYPWVLHPENWEYPPLYTYALLSPGTDVEWLEAELPAIAARHMGEHRTETRSLHVERLTDIHLRSDRESDITPGSSIVYIYVLSLVGLLILLIACINFINLLTAQAVERAREVGMRKALGAVRNQVTMQFLMETMLMTTAAVVLGILLSVGLMPTFNALAGKSMPLNYVVHWTAPVFFLGLVVVVGIVAGGYPAVYLSRFLPMDVLHGRRFTSGYSHTSLLRKGLVVFQFVVSITLLIGTIVVNRQLDFLQNERLGFDKEHVVIVPLRDQDNVFNYEPLEREWEQLQGVLHVSASSGMPGLQSGIHDFMIKPRNALQDSLEMKTLTVDHDFVETYGIEIAAGRDFDEQFPSDASEAFLINEAAARKLGWDAPLGQQLTLQVWFNGEVQKSGTVIGVLKDFQYNSLHRAIEPILLHVFPKTYYNDYLSVRLKPEDLAGTLADMKEAWAGFNPSRPFEYSFLDENFDTLYRAEAKMSQLFSAFAFLALMIGCFGLFGLSSYIARQRFKEVGIRKVLGSSVWGIIGLLSSDFLKLVGISFVIAVPIAYVTLNRWLEGFAERIDLEIVVFLMAGLLTLIVAFISVNYQAYRAANMNPVRALRYE